MSKARKSRVPQPSQPVAGDFRAGCQFYARGELEAAEQCFRAVLARQPAHVDALSNLGVVLRARGRLEEAVLIYGTALRICPSRAHLHCNLGNALTALGRHAEALAAYTDAVATAPTDKDALLALARTLHRAGRSLEAIDRLKSVLQLYPEDFGALDLLGLILVRCRDFELARDYLARAAQLQPECVRTLNNLGCALIGLGRLDEAKQVLQAAVKVAPNECQPLISLGDIAFQTGDLKQALEHFQRAAELKPESVNAWFRLGCALSAQGAARAAETFQRVLELDPEHFSARLWMMGHTRKCADFEGAALNSGYVSRLLPREIAAGEDWTVLANCAYSALFQPLAHDTYDAMTRRIDLLLAREAGRQAPLPSRLPRCNQGRIRIGYLSPNFRDHPVGHVTRSLFARHRRDRFEIHGFSTAFRSDHPDYTPAIRAGFDAYHFVGRHSPWAAAEIIRRAGIDILVDLDGYMDCSSPPILALRPAPIQIFWLGHAGGLGLSFVDYLIADQVVVPSGEEWRYREKIIRLPDVYHCADTPLFAAGQISREECGLPRDGFVFCGFNNPQKIQPATFDSWMRILRRVPNSCLWLSNTEGSRNLVENLRRRAERAGVAPGRLVFADRLASKAVHLSRHHHAGLFLDSVDCLSASTTALDALWAGTPVLTIRGDRFASRIASTLLHCLQLDELICDGLADYEERAVEIARDPPAASRLAAQLKVAVRTTPLFNGDRFVRGLEQAYEKAWTHHLAGRSPEGFDLPSIDSLAASDSATEGQRQ